MKYLVRMGAAALLLPSTMLAAQAPTPSAPTPPAPITRPMSPSEIVATSVPSDWVAIEPADLLVMELAPDPRGRARRVIIQLMPAPFSQGWVGNIRALAAAHWWDGLSVNRVQDNYVVQWGDADGEEPAKARALPAGLSVVGESEYMLARDFPRNGVVDDALWPRNDVSHYGTYVGGFPIAAAGTPDSVRSWPVHCYGMVGVGRGLSPDTGTGAELYTVIGHAPHHLDANIALVGRVIEGIEHLSSLPRGTGPLGFYESAEQRVPIASVRMGSEVDNLPNFQFLNTSSDSFMRYAEARANRRDPFFIRPAGGADICNIPVPVRRVQPLP